VQDIYGTSDMSRIRGKTCMAVSAHGEATHPEAEAAIAEARDVSGATVGQHGDLYMITLVPGHLRSAAQTGRLGWENGTLTQTTDSPQRQKRYHPQPV
jgi:hypothetical protein